MHRTKLSGVLLLCLFRFLMQQTLYNFGTISDDKIHKIIFAPATPVIASPTAFKAPILPGPLAVGVFPFVLFE